MKEEPYCREVALELLNTERYPLWADKGLKREYKKVWSRRMVVVAAFVVVTFLCLIGFLAILWGKSTMPLWIVAPSWVLFGLTLKGVDIWISAPFEADLARWYHHLSVIGRARHNIRTWWIPLINTPPTGPEAAQLLQRTADALDDFQWRNSCLGSFYGATRAEAVVREAMNELLDALMYFSKTFEQPCPLSVKVLMERAEASWVNRYHGLKRYPHWIVAIFEE